MPDELNGPTKIYAVSSINPRIYPSVAVFNPSPLPDFKPMIDIFESRDAGYSTAAARLGHRVNIYNLQI